MQGHFGDTFEITFLGLTVLYYSAHMGGALRHLWHRAIIKLREATRGWKRAKAVFVMVATLILGGCVQSGPVLLYLLHLAHKMSPEQASPAQHEVIYVGDSVAAKA